MNTKYRQCLKTNNSPIKEKKLIDRAFLRFWLCGDLIGRCMDIKLAKELGGDRTMYNIMANLVAHNGKMEQKDLAADASRSKQATTLAIDRLEKRGFIERISHPEDRRVNIIRMTESGNACFKRVVPRMMEMSHQALSCLSEVELEQFFGIANKLLPSLREYIVILRAKGDQPNSRDWD